MPAPTSPSPVTERAIVYALLFGSGLAGLVYQVLWMRQLGLLFGHTAQAAAATLSVFFLGLAAGGYLWGRRASQMRNPFRTYALLELGIAITALLCLPFFWAFRRAYAPIFHALGERPELFLLAKLALALVLLLPPTLLMGGTLPAIGQALVRRPGTLGAVAGRIYGTQTAGAALGAFLAAFVLPTILGYRGAYGFAVLLSAAVGIAALRLAREDARTTRAEPATSERPSRSLMFLACLSGLLTLALEVLWVRMFAQVLQNSVYSYAVILVTFLAALAAGARLAQGLSTRLEPSPMALGLLLAGAGLAIALSTRLFFLLTDGLTYVAGDGGWIHYICRIFGLAGLTMGPAALLAGGVFPYLFRLAEERRLAPGATLGWLSAINTVGGIAGSLGAGFLLLRWAGLWRSLQWISLIYLAAAAAVFLSEPRRRHLGMGLALAGALLVLILGPGGLDSVRLRGADGERVVDLRHGSHGIVAVLEDEHGLRIKVDNHYTLGGTASLEGERRQAHIPLLAHPRPRSVFFLGLGTGLTAGGAMQHPVEEVVAAELVPEVVAAARQHFRSFTEGLFDDPRVRIVAEDGRNYLHGTRETFDLVIADLFIPWKRGAGALYTREHFTSVEKRLAPGGIFAQWLPLYQLTREELRVIAHTMLQVFPQVTLWRGDVSARQPIVGLFGHREPTTLDPAALVTAARRLAERQATDQQQLPESGPFLFYAGNLSQARDLLADAPINTDDRPWIELRAPVSHRAKRADATTWVTSYELLDWLQEIFDAVPPQEDSYLARLSDRQRGYVRAGAHLYRANVLFADGREAAARREMAQVARLLGLTPQAGTAAPRPPR